MKLSPQLSPGPLMFELAELDQPKMYLFLVLFSSIHYSSLLFSFSSSCSSSCSSTISSSLLVCFLFLFFILSLLLFSFYSFSFRCTFASKCRLLCPSENAARFARHSKHPSHSLPDWVHLPFAPLPHCQQMDVKTVGSFYYENVVSIALTPLG